MAANTKGKKVVRKRRERKNVEKGQVHIRSSFNNTMVTVTDAQGNASYSLVPWFRHGVTPTAPPAWCGGWIIAKDSYNVCGFSPESKQYFLLEVKSGAPSFGDYLASTGSVKRVVTYSNIDNTTLQGESQQYCCVRVWEPV